MARDYSAAARRKLAATSGEAPLTLLEISHPDLGAPIRVVADTQDLVHLGDVFVALAFDIELPDEMAHQAPRASLAVDNVGRAMTDWIEASNGGEGATVRIMQVMRDDPDVVEWEAALDLSNVSMTRQRITGSLGFEDLLNRPGVLMRYDPRTAPGLF